MAAIAASGLDPKRLELEITETVLLERTEEVLVVLHRLRDFGVKIAMDDFGTGYSSLSYLHSFPFDKIKIDRSFTKSTGKSSQSMAIVQAVLGLGKNLGMSTTAEGVETVEQLNKLREEGCVELQGYLFSKPVPANEVKALLDRLRSNACHAGHNVCADRQRPLDAYSRRHPRRLAQAQGRTIDTANAAPIGPDPRSDK